MQNLQKSLQKVNDKIIAPTKLLAVSKRKPLQMIEAAYELGQRDFGENHILELLEKSEKLKHLDIRWHMIGHIQSNKLNHLLKVKNPWKKFIKSQIIPIDPAVKPTARKKINSTRSLGKEFTINLK